MAERKAYLYLWISQADFNQEIEDLIQKVFSKYTIEITYEDADVKILITAKANCYRNICSLALGICEVCEYIQDDFMAWIAN